MISIYFCLLPLILSQIYHNAAIVTYLLPDKAGGDVEKLVFMKEINNVDYRLSKLPMVKVRSLDKSTHYSFKYAWHELSPFPKSIGKTER